MIAAASAAGLPVGEALAQPPGTSWDGTTVSVEGGVAFSNYWTTTFPGSPASLIPQPSPSSDKVGSPPVSSAPLESKHNVGGYGSFSVGRNINPTLDWRFSAAFYDFATTESSAGATQLFTGEESDTSTNSALIRESNRFGFQTLDFDLGKMWTQGPVQLRGFAGLRALHTIDRFDVMTATEGTDKTGLFTTTTTDTTISRTGSSHFTGVGPRVGLEFFTGSNVGLVGSVSGALIGGYRTAHFDSTTTVVVNGGAPTITQTTISGNRGDWVGNLQGMVGVAFQFAPNGQFVLGYKADQWYNIRDSFSFAGFSNQRNVLTHTPFLKVTVRY
jgi:hypothetical protein